MRSTRQVSHPIPRRRSGNTPDRPPAESPMVGALWLRVGRENTDGKAHLVPPRLVGRTGPARGAGAQ
jgi:hypothetical protein